MTLEHPIAGQSASITAPVKSAGKLLATLGIGGYFAFKVLLSLLLIVLLVSPLVSP